MAPCLVRVVSLRRPDVVVRSTTYENLVVDERLLTKAFPWVATPTHLVALALVAGSIVWDGLRAAPGDVVLLRPEHMAEGRFHDARFVELEWPTPEAERVKGPSLVGRAPEGIADVDAQLVDPRTPDREVLARVFDYFFRAGVAHGLDASRLEGGPSALDLRIARALDAQLASLGTAADTLHLAELTSLSERQVQRVVTAYLRRAHQNARSWRDLRNRWRVQIAAVLLGSTKATAAAIADEVGYASLPALCRALAAHGMPRPREIRRRAAEDRGP